MNVVKIGALNETREVDFAALPANSQAFVIQYGLKQLLNDALVSGENVEEKRGLVDKKLDGLRSGNLRSTAERSDALQAEVNKIALKLARDKFRKDGKKLVDYAAGIDAYAKELIATKPIITETAKANIAATLAISID